MQATGSAARQSGASAAQPTAAPAAHRTGATNDASVAADLYALITHLHRNCNADLFEAVGALELSLTQIKLLHHLDDSRAALTLKQGAEAVRVSLPAASRLVEDLVHRGLVERHEDLTDRRMKRIRLTDHGRDVIRRLNAARLSGLEHFVGTLAARDRHALERVLDQLLAREDIAACRPPLGHRDAARASTADTPQQSDLSPETEAA